MSLSTSDPQLSFDLTTNERDRRWSAAREIMKRHDVDAVIAYSDFGDQAGLQRYLSNFRSSYDYQAVVLFENDCEVFCSHPGAVALAKQLSWATQAFPMARPVPPAGHSISDKILGKGSSVGGQVANRLNARGVKRVGVVNMDFFPVGWKETLEATVSGIELMDVWDDFHRLRLVKGPEEQKLVREACRISDEVWKVMPDIFRVGRRRYEVLADIEQIIRHNGCEDSFNMCMYVPMGGEPIDRSPYSAMRIEENAVYFVEVSPRYLGYYGQQSGLIATGDIPADLANVYAALSRSRAKGLEVLKPGVDLLEVGAAIDAQLRADGYEPPSPSFGHAVGLELEDEHISGRSLILEEGMTFILHPFAAGYPGLLRADTYLVTAEGVECLTSEDVEPLILK